jgi:hypothetical protein
MKCLRSFVTIGLTLILSQSAFPQSPSQKTKAPVKSVSSKEKSEAERIHKERQAQARSLLISLASDARSFRDQTLRARSLARIADALWEIDAEQGRTLFRKAWEAAEIANREANERLNIRDGVVAIKPEEMNAATLASMVSNPDIRKELLRLVALHDRTLSEEFLEKLKEPASEEIKSEKPRTGLWDVPEALRQRLSLAETLVRTGNTERALQLAEPALSSVTGATLDFLTLLRMRDSAAADQRYAAMLAGTSNNMLADANTISLLSSYIFTPNTYVIFNTDGAATGNFAPASPANVSPQLRLAFFQTASAVLLRPQPPPDQDQSTTGIAGKFMVIRRLLPLFEQYAPPEMSASLRAQFEALNSLVSDSVRRGESESVQKGITPEEPFAAQETSLLDQVEHAKTSDERDQLYFQLASLALKNDDLKARDYVSKIEESEFRKQAQAWIDWGLTISAVKNQKAELALELNRIGELTHIQRVWVLTQTSKLLAKTDREKASSLLETASAEARRISGSDLDRPRALFAIANAFRVVESARVSEAAFDAVKAANSAEGFVGEGGVITQMINSKNVVSVIPQDVPDFDIAEIFGALALDDYENAVQLARGFQAEAPRTNATLAIARSVLNQKPAPVRTP